MDQISRDPDNFFNLRWLSCPAADMVDGSKVLYFEQAFWRTPNKPFRQGILVFAFVMATLGLQIILESVRTLVNNDSNFKLTNDQERWVVGIMLSVTIVKLVFFLYCRTFTNEIVKTYAQDHFFDVITNIIGLVAVLLANYISQWMDPVGAIIGFAYLPAVICVSSIGRPISYDQAIAWKHLSNDNSSHSCHSNKRHFLNMLSNFMFIVYFVTFVLSCLSI